MDLKPVIFILGPSGLPLGLRLKKTLEGAMLHGFQQRFSGNENQKHIDCLYEDAGEHLRMHFTQGHPIIGVCAAAILIRSLGPILADKTQEPPVLAVAEDGSVVIPLLGGHQGANDLAQMLAERLNMTGAITNASEVTFGQALDRPPSNIVLANSQDTKTVIAGLLAGDTAHLDGNFDWLADTSLKDILTKNSIGNRHMERRAEQGVSLILRETIMAEHGNNHTLIYHPKKLVLGIGCERGCSVEALRSLVHETLNAHHLAPQAVGAIVSLDLKADETAIHALAEDFGLMARFITGSAINAIAERLPNPSKVVEQEVGVPGVAEGVALVAAGKGGYLRVEKKKGMRATLAIAEAKTALDYTTLGRARGRLSVIGLGPGQFAWRSPEASEHLRDASDWVGYGLYLDLATDLAENKRQHRFNLGAEEERVHHALELAGEGRNVALLCSGDAGIYAMGSLVFETLHKAYSFDVADEMMRCNVASLSDAARRVEVVMVPGISAFQAAAARLGAPIGHDFCCLSLSDLLTPWEVIEQRIEAAAKGDFVTALYNPRSIKRRDQLTRAMSIFANYRLPNTPVAIATNLGRDNERLHSTRLADFNPDEVDMLSLVLIGSSTSQIFKRGDGKAWIYTPRGYHSKKELLP